MTDAAPLRAQTFIFMDLVGFTTLTAERGDGDAADVALRLYRQVRALLKRHGAEEIKTIGDAMMLRCEAPRSGVDLGLELSERVQGSGDLPPLRIAVHTGSAVHRDGDWYGNGVNVAARLCSVAGGGEVLVSDDTVAAVGSPRGVEFAERRLHWLKNVPEPVVTWSAAAKPVRRLERRRALPALTPLRWNGLCLHPRRTLA